MLDQSQEQCLRRALGHSEMVGVIPTTFVHEVRTKVVGMT